MARPFSGMIGRGKLPDRWLDYSNVGGQIPGTPFIAFKVPLNETVCRNLPPEHRFFPDMVIDLLPSLGMVIDLTATKKYYSPELFRSKGIRHEKLMCQGHVIPANHLVEKFFKAVDEFMGESRSEGSNRLIGVHCTHGLNRTGFFICCYMIQKMGFGAEDAILTFNAARGHPMERDNYLQALRELLPNRIMPTPGSSDEPEIVVVTNGNSRLANECSSRIDEERNHRFGNRRRRYGYNNEETNYRSGSRRRRDVGRFQNPYYDNGRSFDWTVDYYDERGGFGSREWNNYHNNRDLCMYQYDDGYSWRNADYHNSRRYQDYHRERSRDRSREDMRSREERSREGYEPDNGRRNEKRPSVEQRSPSKGDIPVREEGNWAGHNQVVTTSEVKDTRNANLASASSKNMIKTADCLEETSISTTRIGDDASILDSGERTDSHEDVSIVAAEKNIARKETTDVATAESGKTKDTLCISLWKKRLQEN